MKFIPNGLCFVPSRCLKFTAERLEFYRKTHTSVRGLDKLKLFNVI